MNDDCSENRAKYTDIFFVSVPRISDD